MSKFFKSLLLLLSAGLFTATGWAAELVIPYSFDGKTGNTEIPYEYKVVMPNTALTSFTTTIRYAGGSHRVEIISVKLLDGETTYTAEATGTDGTVGGATGSYSGNNNYHNVYTFTNNAGFTASKVYTLQANLKVENANPSHNGNIKVSGGITLDVQPFSFGVNFKTADAQNISTTTGAGFAKGDYAAPINWANYTADGGNHATYTIDATAIDVSWVARGSHNSGCSTDTDAGKLLYGYLDDVANNARTKATVTISGLPENKKYAVALVLSGDGNGEANFNNRFSPVWINNEVYAYNSEATLVKGDAAKEIQYWGSRAASAATEGLVEGTNVMFVEGLSGGAISITSAMDNPNVSRLTIAGIQVWVTDEAAEAPAAPEDKETISLNFYSSQGSVSGEAGLVAAGGWNNLGNSGSESALNVWTGEKAVSYPMTLTYSSNNGYQWTTATDAFLKGFLDDGGNHAQISLTGIPFEEYSVIVYAATDTASRKFRSVTINGQAYIGTPGATTLGYALPVYNNTHARYGASHALTAAYGTNALRVDGLSGDLNIVGGANEFTARGGIAAIQIINTGDALPDAQVIDWTAQPVEQLKTSALPELTNVEVQLKLADDVTLEMDSIITGHTIEIVGNNVTVNVTNLEISQAAAQAIFPGATVTTAYTETIGYTKDNVNYSLVYRGGMDGWATLSNWYIGTRTNGSETYWIPYTGTVVPGAPDSNTWDVGLIDGDLIGDKITADEDGYKVVNTPTLEGWALTITIANGVHIKVPTMKKLQGDCVINVDATSKMTVTNKGSGNNGTANTYNIDAEEGLVFENMPMPGGTAYLGLNGSITTGTFASQQTIGGVTLDLGDSTLTGRQVVTRTLYTYTSGTTFSVAENAVTTSEESVTAEAADILQNVGQYKFETKADSYCVSYVAYAEDDKIGEVSTWTAKEDTTWATEGNWTFGVPTAGADAVISIAADTTITIPAEGVTVGVLTVNGEGTLTIAGGKITATKILAEANIAADENTLALAEMDIAEGKTVAYTTTTTVASLDQFNNSHALALKALTGEGTLVKKGTGVIGLFNTKAEPAIDVQQGAIYVRNVPTTAMNIAAKAGAEIRLAAWWCDFNNNANSLKLEGGAQLTLANGSGLAGTITIAEAAGTPAKICGMSFNAATVSAAITGVGKVEFANGGTFGEGAYPCDNATTYSGVISGDLQVIISDTSAVTFTGANTYTGGTVIAEGVTVTVSNLTSIFGTGAITGAGTVKIAGGTYEGLSLAQYTDANTTIEIPADNTVTGYFNSATWTCAAKIQLDGTLSLTDGYGAGKYTFTGPWAGAGAISLSNSPNDVVRITGDISGFTGNISVAGGRALTFCAESTAFNQKYSGKICVHGDYAYTAKVNGTWSAPVVVENGAKIGGEGSIDNTLTFNAGSIIDGAVTATGDVTLNGAVTVSGEAGATVLTCANAASLDLTKFAAPAGLKCVAEDGAVKLTIAERPVTDAVIATVPAGGALTLADALGDAVLAANATLTIDFGSEGGEAGTFTFNNEEAITLTSITVIGTNGGTIVMADGAEIAYGTLVLNTTVAADAAFYAENTGAIEGTGKLCLASGELTFSGANTYTGGTDIATGATLTITNADAIGTGAITGAGTLACDGFMPTNKTGLTDAENWTGTLALVSTPEQTDIAFNSLGNASSTVRLQDYTGGLSTHTNTETDSTIPVNLEIKGTNTINRPTGGAVPIFQGKITGDSTSTIDFQTNTNTNYLFTGDFSEFKGTLNLSGTGPKVAIGPKDWTTWSQFNKLNEHQGKITIFTDVVVNGTFIAVNGVMVGGSGTTPTLSGNGTIDSALTLTANATIDASATLLTVTGAVTLPDALTVKIAAAPAVGTVVPLLNAANVTIPEGMTIAVMVGDTPAEGTYQLIKTPTALLLENVPAEDVTIEGSNIAAAQSYPSNQQGNYDTYGVQVDLDGSTPYAPGWVSGVYYPLASFAVVSDATGRVAVDTCVQVVDVDNPSNVVATSAPFQNENMESVSVVCSDVTKDYYRYTFKFEAPVYVDAAKTYQFRFVNGEGAAVACKLRALYTSADQSYCNWLNNQYEVINSGAVTPRYMPYVVLTAECIVDNSPILSGGDETLPVDAVPEKIRLNTATFGYGTHTVLQYTGEDTPDWTQMQVEGLPAGVTEDDFVIDEENKTWGFLNHTLTVWPIGDSITAGLVKYNEGGSANWHVAGGYRLPLYQFLNQAGYGVNYIGTSLYPTSQTNDSCSNSCEDRDIDSKILTAAGLLHHEGHSGTTLDQLYTRFKKATVQTILASQGTPDVITLHLGTNDLGGGNSVDTAKTEMKKLLYVLNGAAAEEYTSTDPVLYPNAKILVAKIIPRSDRDLASSLNEFNTWLETYAAACPEKLVLVDLGMDTSYTLLRHDGLHPSPEGYKQMARGWFAAIEKTIAPLEADETIASVDARVANTLTVTTNKAIDTSLTQTWTLDNEATVSAATIADDKRTVTLTVEGVVAGAEYTLTATNLFAADDSVTKTFTTTDIHTPTTDVTDTSATELATKLDGVTKAAEWTTFAGFDTGYTSPIGYMPESGRAWQLDVRGANEPTVKDGVLSLNGAPLTVNFVDGHIGNTSSTYTMVMTVSNLSANDVIVTESMTSITVNGSVEGSPSGTPAPDAIQLKVNEDAKKLLWGTTEIPVEVDLTDDEPDTIVLSGKWVNGDDSYSIVVNGGAKTNLPVSGASQIIRGSWSIGAMSEADTGSFMKLYRLSFYEGAATVVMPETTAIIDVGEGDGQYTTWLAAKTGLNLADEMESLTINFTAADQTFTFDNAGEVSLATLSVQGEAGTLAKTGAGTVTVSEETQIATTLTVAGQIQLNGITIEEGAMLAISDYRVIGTPIAGAGTLSVSNATLTQALDAKLVAETWTGTVVLNAIQDSLLDVAKLVNAASNLTLNGEVEAYVYNCSMNQLTLNGSFRGINGTSNSELVQTATVAKLVGEGTLYGHATANGSTAHVRLFFADVTGFAGSVDLPDEKDCGTTILFGPGATTAGGKVVVSTQATIASGKAWTAKNGFDITTNGTLDLNGNTLTASALTGSGRIVDNAETKGSLVIDGTTDFAGVLEIGTLQVNADASFTLSGATDSTVSSLSGDGTLMLNNANNNTVAHLVLTGASNYNGAICLDGNTELKLSGVEQESIKTGATLNVLGSLQLNGAAARLNTLDAGFSDALVKIASEATLITGGASGRQNANVEMADGAVLDVSNQSLSVSGFKLASETAVIEVIAGETGALLSAGKGVDALTETTFRLSAESPILSESVTGEMLHFYVMPGFKQVALVQVEADLDGLSEADKQAIFWTVYIQETPVREITNRDVPAIFVADYGSGYFMTTTPVTEDGVEKMDVAYAVNFGISEITAHKDAEDNILFNITATVEPYQTGAAIEFQQNVKVDLLKGNVVVATQTIGTAGVSVVCFENVSLLPTEAGTVTLTVRATSVSE